MFSSEHFELSEDIRSQGLVKTKICFLPGRPRKRFCTKNNNLISSAYNRCLSNMCSCRFFQLKEVYSGQITAFFDQGAGRRSSSYPVSKFHRRRNASKQPGTRARLVGFLLLVFFFFFSPSNNLFSCMFILCPKTKTFLALFHQPTIEVTKRHMDPELLEAAKQRTRLMMSDSPREIDQ